MCSVECNVCILFKMDTQILNINVGVLGHVDSGKTSLAKALSTTASTASFDKNPQSKERGITIDLGFSSLLVDIPDSLKVSRCNYLQFTWVDCPGHASLIRTIIGGAQIINLMLLVIDVTKGMQTQTAECLVIGEITCKKMIVVLNKIDLLPEEKRATMIQKMTKKLKSTFNNTLFKDCPIVSIAANPGGADAVERKSDGIEELIGILKEQAFIPEQHLSNPFLFAVDHCFSIHGQGTVMTGTVLQGSIKINETIEIPSLKTVKKVKSLQMFRQPVESAGQGDRLGMCVTQFDPKQLERGLVCAPAYISSISAAIISVQKIKYFKGNVFTKARFHISVGYETVMAKITVFGLMCSSPTKVEGTFSENCFNFDQMYKYQEELLFEESNNTKETEKPLPVEQFALLEFEKPIMAVPKCLVIGSRLDIDVHTTTCRLAFWGHVLEGIEDKNYTTTVLPNLKIYKDKYKCGVVERMVSEEEVIGKHIFKKETNIQVFVGLKVILSTGETGIIEGSFGQSGKVKIHIPGRLSESTVSQLSSTSKKKGKHTITQNNSSEIEAVKFTLPFKRLIFDPDKKIVQS